MLLSAPTQAQREQAGVIGVASVDHGGAPSAKAHRPRIAAFRDFLVNRKGATQESELIAGDPGGELKRRSSHGLAIGAVADSDQVRVNRGLPLDVATEAAAVDVLSFQNVDLQHFLGE